MALARRGRVGTRLAELVDLRVEDADASERRVLELVAVAAPLEVGLLEPAELEALDALERRELVERRTDGRRRFADVAHPLHGEAVRAQLTPTRLEAIHTRLAGRRRGAWRAAKRRPAADRRLAPGGGCERRRRPVRARRGPRDVGARPGARGAARASGGAVGRRLRRRLRSAARSPGPGAHPRRKGCSPSSSRRPGRRRRARGRRDGVRAQPVLGPGPGRGRGRRSAPSRGRGRRGDACARSSPRSACGSWRRRAAPGRARWPPNRCSTSRSRAGPRRPSRSASSEAHVLERPYRRGGGAGRGVAPGRPQAPRRAAARRGRAARHARAGAAARRAPARGHGAVGGRLRVSRDGGSPRQGTAIEATSLGLIWLARGRVQTALRFCPRGRGAAARRRRHGNAGLRARERRPGRGAGWRAEEARASARGDGATPLAPQGLRRSSWELGRAWSAPRAASSHARACSAREAGALARSRGQAAYAVPSAARALPARRPGGRRPRARPSRQPGSTGPSPRRRPPTPRRSSPGTGPR